MTIRYIVPIAVSDSIFYEHARRQRHKTHRNNCATNRTEISVASVLHCAGNTNNNAIAITIIADYCLRVYFMTFRSVRSG